jgi:hypothetical protein
MYLNIIFINNINIYFNMIYIISIHMDIVIKYNRFKNIFFKDNSKPI